MPKRYGDLGYTRVVAGQNEFLLGKVQTSVWRKIGENDQISVKELYGLIRHEGLDINFEELCDIVLQFLRFGLVVERDELW